MDREDHRLMGFRDSDHPPQVVGQVVSTAKLVGKPQRSLPHLRCRYRNDARAQCTGRVEECDSLLAPPRRY